MTIMFGYSRESWGVAERYLKPLSWGLLLQMDKASLKATGAPASSAQGSCSSSSFGVFMPCPRCREVRGCKSKCKALLPSYILPALYLSLGLGS